MIILHILTGALELSKFYNFPLPVFFLIMGVVAFAAIFALDFIFKILNDPKPGRKKPEKQRKEGSR